MSICRLGSFRQRPSQFLFPRRWIATEATAGAGDPSKLLLAGRQLANKSPDHWPASMKGASIRSEALQDLVRRLDEGYDLVASLHDMASAESDAEMKDLARLDAEQASLDLQPLHQELQATLFPPEPSHSLSALLEVKAGIGGDEAALFSGDLVRMYTRLSQRKKWKVELLQETIAPVSAGVTAARQAYKFALLHIDGRGAYGRLRHEIGVHRVQRIPSTDAAGRIHSSTASVIVFPLLDQRSAPQEDPLNEKDVKQEVMRAGGAGGQHVNKTESAVRLTHLPTGITVSMQDSRSQQQNRVKAYTVLRARLMDHQLQKEQEARKAKRRSQVRSSDRSERIRSFSTQQMRITDHRLPATVTNVDVEAHMENSELFDEFADALDEREQQERLEALLEELEEQQA